MKLKKYGLILLAVALLTVAAIAIPTLAAGEYVVYVNTATAGDSTTDNIYATLNEAIGAVRTAKEADDSITGGKIILCSDIAMSSGSSIELAYCTVPVTVVSEDAAAPKTIKLGDSSEKRFLYCITAITFDDVIFRQAGSKNVEIWTGQSLTIGDNVRFLNNSGNVATTNVWSIRCGYKPASTRDVYLEVNSGSLCMIHLGNDKGIGNVDAVIGEKVKITQFLQVGGTSTDAAVEISTGNVTVDVNGATIGDLWLCGYGPTPVTSAEVTLTGATITGKIGYNRNSKTPAMTSLSLTLDNTSVGGAIAAIPDVVTTAGLTLKNMQCQLNGSLAGWESLSLVNSVVKLSQAYAGPADASAVSIDANSRLLVPVGTSYPNIEGIREAAPMTVVYLSGEVAASGFGDSPASAVKTLEEAYETLADEGGTIVLCGNLTQSWAGGANIDLPAKPATITSKLGSEDYSDKVFTMNNGGESRVTIQFNAPTVFKDIRLNETSPKNKAVELFTGPSLTFDTGVITTFNGNEIVTSPDGRFAVRTGFYNKDYVSSNYNNNPATFIMKSGTLSFVHGGSRGGAVDKSHVVIEGTAKITDMLQCGGTGKNVGASQVEIKDNAQIPDMYVNGYGVANMGSSEITITGGTIAAIRAGRSRDFYNDSNDTESTGTLGSVSLTIGGTAKIGSIDFHNQGSMTFSGTKTLSFQDGYAATQKLTSGFGAGWTAITFGTNSSLELAGAYTNGGTLTMKDGSVLYLNSDGNVNTAAPAYSKVGDAQTGKVELKATHNIVFVAAKPANVFADGYKEHYKCTACGACYSDAEGLNPVDFDTQLKIPSTDGTYHTSFHYDEYSQNGVNFSMSQLIDGTTSQGIAVYKDTLIIANNKGEFSIWDLTTGTKTVGGLRFGSATSGNSNKWSNHSNSIMFSDIFYAEDDPFPLLFVCAGNSGDHIDSDSYYGAGTKGSYFGHLAVERILYDEENDTYTSETVVRVFFNDMNCIPDQEGNADKNMNGNNGTSELTNMYQNGKFTYLDDPSTSVDESQWQKIGWGWPAWKVDSDPTSTTQGKLYITSARFRTTSTYFNINKNKYGVDDYTEDNAYIYTEMDLTGLIPTETTNTANYGKNVILTPADITNQFTVPYNTGFTQGSTLYQGRVYYSYGATAASTSIHSRDYMNIVDIEKEEIVAELHLYKNAETTGLEPECPAVWNGELLLSYNGGIYIFDYVALDEPTVVAPTCEDAGITYVACALCGHNLHTVDTPDPLDHSFTNYVSDGNATCEEDGTKTATCDHDDCGEKDTVADTGSKLAHKLTKVDGKAATCTEEGVIEHYNCSNCKKNFADAEGRTEKSDVTIAAGHDISKVDGKAPTETENGHKEHYCCAACGKLYADAQGKNEITKNSVVISATGAPADTSDPFSLAWIIVMLIAMTATIVLTAKRKEF